MQEQTGILPSQEVTKEFFCLSSATFHIYRAKDCNDVFKQELCIIPPTTFQPLLSGTSHPAVSVRLLFSIIRVRVQETEHPQLATDPFPRP